MLHRSSLGALALLVSLAPAVSAQRLRAPSPYTTAPPRLEIPRFDGRDEAPGLPRLASSARAALAGYRTDPSPGSAPDGHTWFDSNEAALALDGGFESIAASGDNLGLSDDDAALVTLPFGFEFYGDVYAQVAVHTNGLLSFTSTAAVPYGDIGDPAEPNTVVAALWIDLAATSGGGVYTTSTLEDGREVFVVEWHEMTVVGSPHPTDPPVTFQARLYADGEIRFAYPFDFVTSLSGPQGDVVGIESRSAAQYLHVGAALFDSSIPFIPQGYTVVIQPPVSPGFGVSPRSMDGAPVDLAYVTTPCGSQPSRVQEFVVRTGASSVSASVDDDAFVVLDPEAAVVDGEAIVRVALVGQAGDLGPQSATLTIAGVDIPLYGRNNGALPEAYTEAGGGYVVRTSVEGCGDVPAAPAEMLPFGPSAGDRGRSISQTVPDSLALATPFRLYGEPYSKVYVNATGTLTFEEPATPYRILVDLPPNDGSETAVAAPAAYGYYPSSGGGFSLPVRGAAYGGVRDVTGDGVDDLVVTFYRVPQIFGGYATWQAVLAPSATPGTNGTLRYTYFAGEDPNGGEPYTVLQDKQDGLSRRGVAGVAGDQAALATESRSFPWLADPEQPPMFDVVLGSVAVELVPRTETVVGTEPGPFRAGWRLLSAPAAGMTVAALAEQNLVQGLPDSYPRDGNGAPAQPNLFTSYDGVAGYGAPTGLADVLVPGEGIYWYFYNLDLVPNLTTGTSQSVALPAPLVTAGTPQTTTAHVPLTAAAAPGEPRWEMVGNPFEEPLWLVPIPLWATGGTLGSSVGQVWDAGHRTYIPTTLADDTLAPWQGMFIEGGTATALDIQVPVAQNRNRSAAGRNALAFSLTGVDAAGRPTLDRAAVLVVEDGASDGWDLRDASKLAVEAPSATLAFVGDRDGAEVLKSQESRPPGGAFTVPLAVAAVGVTGDLVLRWDGLGALPSGWSARLTDTETGAVTALAEAQGLAFAVTPVRSAAESEGAPAPRAARSAAAPRFLLHVTTGAVVGTEAAALPAALSLDLAGPNPVASETRVRLSLPEASAVRLSVFDVVGREVARVVDRPVDAGEHVVPLDVRRLAAGTYVVRMQAGRDVRSVRLLVAR